MLGTLVTHEALVADATVRDRLTAIADASAIVGSHATRAQGTIGGNVMNASPAMDTGGPLLCLGATATLRSATGERTLEARGAVDGPGKTVATPQELLTSVRCRCRGPARGRHTFGSSTAARWRSRWSARPRSSPSRAIG